MSPVDPTEPARAYVAHRTARRTRLRFVGCRGRTEYFERLHESLRDLSGVDEVRTDPRTGSVLVLHSCELSDIASHAQRERLFALEPRPPAKTLNDLLREASTSADRQLRQASEGFVDLESLSTLALLGAGIYQIARGGTVLPAGVTLLWNAIGPLWKAVPKPAPPPPPMEGQWN